MSKATDSLRILPPKQDILHDAIAETYFYKKSHKKRHHKTAHKKLKALPFIIFSTVGAAILISGTFSFLNSHYIAYLQKKFENSKLMPLISSGSPNTEIIKKFEFRGLAKNNSRISEKTIFLTNPKKYSWADMSLDFKFPANFSNRTISLSLKGKMGGERINLILKDAENRSSILKDIFLTSGWKTEVVALNDAKGDIDLSKINSLRLECSYMGDPPKETDVSFGETTIYIKDIRILKKEMRI